MIKKIKEYLKNIFGPKQSQSESASGAFDKIKLWRIITISSAVLFFILLFLIIWQIAFRQDKKYETGSPESASAGQIEEINYQPSCEGCVRRSLDGAYVKPEAANLPAIAIMIDNHPEARPPAGIEKAGLIYEAEVEGSYTRLMAVFSDNNKIGKIGPIRSARAYFVDWAQELNAVYGHCGGSPEALVEIAKKKIIDLNEMHNGQYFWRGEDRKAPHNIFTSSDNLNKFLENKKITSGDFSPWSFKDDSPETEGIDGAEIKINYSQPNFKVTWVYNKGDNDYLRYYGDRPQLTAESNLITAKNIIIQTIPANVVDDKLRLAMETDGQGLAIICQDGACQKGEWIKDKTFSRTRFYLKKDEEVKFNSGTTWIEVIRPEVEIAY